MPLLCLECGGEMKIIAYIKEQSVIDRILNHIGEPAEAPTSSQARGPPAGDASLGIRWDATTRDENGLRSSQEKSDN